MVVQRSSEKGGVPVKKLPPMEAQLWLPGDDPFGAENRTRAPYPRMLRKRPRPRSASVTSPLGQGSGGSYQGEKYRLGVKRLDCK